MGFTGAILCLFVAMIVSKHVTVRGQGVCDDNPCLNGGQCIDVSFPGATQEFKCACPEGYKGLTCQKRIDPCAAEPCFNGGSCIPHGENYHCACFEDYQGRNCEMSKVVRETCADKPCGANGLCSVVNDDIYCECYSGYRGPRCETSDRDENTEETEARNDGEEDDKSSGSRAKPDDKKTDALLGVGSTILVVLLILLIIIFILLCHCCRFCIRKSELENSRKVLEVKGQTPPPAPGFWEINAMLFKECLCPFCWRCFGQSQTTQVVSTEEISLLNKDRLLETTTRIHNSDPSRNPPSAVYAKDTAGSEFAAYEDPNDARLQADSSLPDLNDNKVKRNRNRNFKSRDSNHSKRRPGILRIKTQPSSGRQHRKKRKQVTHENSEESDDSSGGDNDDDDDDDDDSSSDESDEELRAPRGELPGFSKIAAERRPRRSKKGSSSRGGPLPEQETRRFIKGKHSKRKSDRAYQPSDDEDGQDSSAYRDDGYTSVSRMSESDAGGRCRDPQSMHLCSEAASVNYHARHRRSQHAAPQGPMRWPESGRHRRELVSRGELFREDGSEESSGEDAPIEDVESGNISHGCLTRRDQESTGPVGQLYSVDRENEREADYTFRRKNPRVLAVRSRLKDGRIYSDASRNSGPHCQGNCLASTGNGYSNQRFNVSGRVHPNRRLPYALNNPPQYLPSHPLQYHPNQHFTYNPERSHMYPPRRPPPTYKEVASS